VHYVCQHNPEIESRIRMGKGICQWAADYSVLHSGVECGVPALVFHWYPGREAGGFVTRLPDAPYGTAAHCGLEVFTRGTWLDEAIARDDVSAFFCKACADAWLEAHRA
jgi:hypothetical protein